MTACVAILLTLVIASAIVTIISWWWTLVLVVVGAGVVSENGYREMGERERAKLNLCLQSKAIEIDWISFRIELHLNEWCWIMNTSMRSVHIAGARRTYKQTSAESIFAVRRPSFVWFSSMFVTRVCARARATCTPTSCTQVQEASTISKNMLKWVKHGKMTWAHGRARKIRVMRRNLKTNKFRSHGTPSEAGFCNTRKIYYQRQQK